MKYRFLLPFMIMFFMVGTGLTGNGETGFAVLKISGSVEGLASMGVMELFTDDAAALFTSPASVLYPGKNISINHIRWYQDSRFNSMAVRNGSGNFAWGIGLRSFSIEGIEIRDKATPEALGTTGSYYYTLNFAAGKLLDGGIKLGAGIKYLFERHYIESAHGVALDVSASMDFNKIPFQLAAGVSNLGKVTRLWKESTCLPLSIYAAGLYDVMRSNTSFQVKTGALIKVIVPSEQAFLRLGGELTFRNIIISELGFNFSGKQTGYSAGIGLQMNAFRFHYALSAYENSLGYPQQLTVIYRW